MNVIVNPFFENTLNVNEQNLMDDLIVESIQISGTNVYYVMRTLLNYDPIYGADDSSIYDQAVMIEMYLENYTSFEGDRDFMSKFAGLEIRDQLRFSVSRTRFIQEIGDEFGLVRPREGDIIFFPQNKKSFQIKFVNQVEMMFPLGALYTWVMTCELFEYSNETFYTGIPDIDIMQLTSSTNVLDYAITDMDDAPLKTSEGDFIVSETYVLGDIVPNTDNQHVEDEAEANNYLDWSETNPFSTDDSGSHKI